MCAAVVASGDTPPVLDPAEDVFDLVTLSVDFLVVEILDLAVFAGRDARGVPCAISAARNQSLS